MAILGQIQRRSSVLIMIIALALFAFIIQGLLKNSSTIGKGGKNIIAEIDGRKITAKEFQQRIASNQKRNKNISNMEAMKAVWEQTIREAVLNNEYDKLGIQVSEERLRELLVNHPQIKQMFTNQQGVFDENALLDFMKSVYNNSNREPERFQQWKSFENSLIETEKEKIFMDVLKAALDPTIKEGKWLYHFENDAVDFKYAAVPYKTIPDSTIQVSKQEISTYVNKYPERYKTEEGRDIEYIYIPLKASQADKEELIQKMKDLIPNFLKAESVEEFAAEQSDVKQYPRYFFKNKLIKEYADKIINLNKDEIFGPYEFKNQIYISRILDTKMVPDSAKAAHILIAYKGAERAKPSITITKEEAKKKADSIFKIVKNNKAKFADYAKDLSDGPSKVKGGDLGWFTYDGGMAPKFREYVFNGKVGDLGVVETSFGFHIIKINELTEPEKAVKMISIVRNISPSTQTEDETFSKASKLASEAMKANDFKKFAADNNLVIKPIMRIGKYEDKLPGIGLNRDIVKWAFEKGNKIGNISKFDIDNNKILGHLIVRLNGITNEGVMSAEEAAPLVKKILLNEKKAAIINKKFSGANFEEMAKNAKAKIGVATGVTLNNPTIPGFGREPKVVAKAFSLQPNEYSAQPIAGKNSVYIVKTIKIKKAGDVKNYANYVDKIKNEANRGFRTNIIEALKEKAEIEDKRDLIYR